MWSLIRQHFAQINKTRNPFIYNLEICQSTLQYLFDSCFKYCNLGVYEDVYKNVLGPICESYLSRCFIMLLEKAFTGHVSQWNCFHVNAIEPH